MFKSPFLATSPYDFWSRRWNILIYEIFHRIIFRFRKWECKNGSTSIYTAALFGMSVFVLSAIMHEWMNFVAFNDGTGDNMIFFVINGIATTAQIIFQKRFGFHNRKIGVFERIALIFSCHIFFALVSKWFLTPYIRAIERENL
jgi:hypothetical protein